MILKKEYGKPEYQTIEFDGNLIKSFEEKDLDIFKKTFTEIDFIQETGMSKLRRKFISEGPMFGLGDKIAPMNKRQKKYTFFNTDNPIHHSGADPIYKSFPFYILIEEGGCTGFFVDFPGYMQFDLDSKGDGIVEYTVRGDGFAEYFITGNDLKEVVRQFTELTGKNVAMPIWALGYQQSRWGEISQDKFVETAQKFRDMGFPCDVLYLDIDHMDKYKVFTWNKEQFPEPKTMFETLHEMGIKVSAIIDPGVKVEEGYHVFDEGEEFFLKDTDGNDFEGAVWPGRVRFPDYTSPETRKWWAEKVCEWKKFGFDGFWNDMNEIAVFITDDDLNYLRKEFEDLTVEHGIQALIKFGELNLGRKGYEDKIVHKDGTEHWKVKNLYGREMTHAAYEGCKKENQGKRPFLISRSAYPGIQKYGGVWTGDNSSWWEHLILEVNRISTLGICGVHYVGCDVGGFGDDTSPELLTRFMQLGAFTPMYRNHSAWNTQDQEPWAFGEKYFEIMKKVTQLRYSYIPYIYSEYMKGISTNDPLFRPVSYNYYSDSKTWNLEDEFMLGDSMLVAPVCRPGVTERAVYLPVNAVELNSMKKYDKGWNIIPAALDTIPHFLLENRIIFKVPVQNYILENDFEEIEIIAFGKKAEGLYYEDDGVTDKYLEGEFIKDSIVVEKGEIKYLERVNNLRKKNKKYKLSIIL